MSGISGLSFGMVATASALDTTTSSETAVQSKAAGTKAVDDFLAYMKKSLAERMADAWLASHGLDREKLKAMKPEEREAVLKQMARELKDELAQAVAKKNQGKTAAA